MVAEKVDGDSQDGVWSAPGSDTVTEGTTTITFSCTKIGEFGPPAYADVFTCISTSDSRDWFTFSFT